MSFTFDESVFLSGEIESLLKEKLNGVLSNTGSSSSKTNETTTQNGSDSSKSYGKIAASDNNVFVKQISFNNKPPIIDILGMSILDSTFAKSSLTNETEIISNNSNHKAKDNKTIKTIVKLVIENFKIELKSDIESNLLLVYGGKNIDHFLLPDFVCNESFNIPINLKFSNCKLETILDLNYQIGSNVKMNFNDVNIAFEFDCSIPLLSSSIKQRLTSNIDHIFKDILPNAILDLSMKYMTKKNEPKSDISKHNAAIEDSTAKTDSTSKSISMDEEEIQMPHLLSYEDQEVETASPVTMMKLGSIASKRFSLSLRNFEEDNAVLERSNLTKILSQKTLKLSKLVESRNGNYKANNVSNTIYEATRAMNVLPISSAMKFDGKFVEQIASLQETLHENSLKRDGKTKKFKRRRIVLGGRAKGNGEKIEETSKKHNIHQTSAETDASSSLAPAKIDYSHHTITAPISPEKIASNVNTAAEDFSKVSALEAENLLQTSSILRGNTPIILSPLPLTRKISSPTTPKSLLMKRIMTPLIFTDNSRSSSLPFSENVEQTVKMNWKKEEQTPTLGDETKINIRLNNQASEKGILNRPNIVVSDSPYRKLIEKTPLKNWLQTTSYLDNFAQLNSNSSNFGKSDAKPNDYHIHNNSNNAGSDLNTILQDLHIAPPPYS